MVALQGLKFVVVPNGLFMYLFFCSLMLAFFKGCDLKLTDFIFSINIAASFIVVLLLLFLLSLFSIMIDIYFKQESESHFLMVTRSVITSSKLATIVTYCFYYYYYYYCYYCYHFLLPFIFISSIYLVILVILLLTSLYLYDLLCHYSYIIVIAMMLPAFVICHCEFCQIANQLFLQINLESTFSFRSASLKYQLQF